jgi:alpha-glucosidase
VDPGGRDGCRAPIPWDGSADHGWPTDDGVTPWLPFPPDADTRNRADLVADPGSVLHLYRRALTLRRAVPALVLGDFELLGSPAGTLVYRRVLDGDACTVAVNFRDEEVDVAGVGEIGAVVLLSSDDPSPTAWSGRLGPDRAVVIRA